MKLLLDAKIVGPVVNSTEPIPDSKTKFINHKAWKFDESKAKAWISVNIEDLLRNYVKRQATIYAMWEELQKIHRA